MVTSSRDVSLVGSWEAPRVPSGISASRLPPSHTGWEQSRAGFTAWLSALLFKTVFHAAPLAFLSLGNSPPREQISLPGLPVTSPRRQAVPPAQDGLCRWPKDRIPVSLFHGAPLPSRFRDPFPPLHSPPTQPSAKLEGSAAYLKEKIHSWQMLVRMLQRVINLLHQPFLSSPRGSFQVLRNPRS